MSELPLSSDALSVAEATMFAFKGAPRSTVVEATVRSFLQNEGFEVESDGDEQRLVSAWRPGPEEYEPRLNTMGELDVTQR